jgi:polysaccharide biosynthesis protein PslG
LIKKARATITVAVAALAMLTVGTASAAAKKAPADFYGVVPQTALAAKDFERMSSGKVGTLRTLLSWASVDQTSAANDNTCSGFDAIVTEAAKAGIEVQPFIFGTPAWVAKDLDGANCSGDKCGLYTPKSPAALDAFKTFVGDTVDRYGPSGTFWTEHPEVPKDPITVWQILNEQNSKSFYLPKPNPKSYAKVLKAADAAIDARDPSAEIVLGGMAELAGSRKAIKGSKYLQKLYKVKGAKNYFDAVAPHPYGATVDRVSEQVELYRKVMKKAHDSKADMYVTEVGAGSAKGGSSLNRGKKGQAKLLKDIYKYFIKQRNKLNVEVVDWFSWQDSRTSICSWCKTSGLLTAGGQTKPSYKEFTKLTGGRTAKHKGHRQR